MGLFTPGCGFLPVPDQKDPVAYYARKDAEEAAIQQRRGPATQPVATAAGSIGDLFRLIGDYIADTTPLDLVRDMEGRPRDTRTPNTPDRRWKAISNLASRWFAHFPPYTTRFAAKAVGNAQTGEKPDPDYVVRATTVRALNRARDASATPVFIQALADESELVRLEAAKALNNLPSPDAAAALLARLNDPNEAMDVRIAAAEAMRHYKSLEVARGLVAALDVREFGIAWQARRSLHVMTKTDMKYDQGKWLTFLTGARNPFG
jgi:hypothetical protein